MADCRRGRIDKILVKSSSRFARNAKESLEAVRELKALGIAVCFEEDKIDTSKLSGELLTAIFAMLAQKESEAMRRIFCGDPEEKIHLLMGYAGQPGQEVADLWNTGDFESTWKDVSVGCQGLLEHLVKEMRTK